MLPKYERLNKLIQKMAEIKRSQNEEPEDVEDDEYLDLG